MDREPDHWTNSPAFNWTPEAPLATEPQLGTRATEAPEPKLERPAPSERPAAAARPAAAPEPIAHFTLAVPEAPAASLLLQRLTVGLGQGVFLALLFATRVAMNPFVFSAALMATLFAPLLLLSGLGRMRFMPLLIWTISAAALLAGAGAYHYWRTLASDSGHPGLSLLALTALFLFVGQALMESRAAGYASHYRSAWRLTIRLVICVCVASLAWAAAGAALGWMRVHYPGLPYGVFILPLVCLSAALAAHVIGGRLLAVVQEGVVLVFSFGLIFVLLLVIAAAGLAAANSRPLSLATVVALGTALILCINASYRDGAGNRAYWRQRAEFAGSVMLLPLALIGCTALAVRVAQYGWTDTRVLAAASVLMLAGYALAYSAAALVSLGGGRWMQRIEAGNLALAFAGLMLLLALASPIADPARLAVAAQGLRLDRQQVPADTFDYIWLRDHGLRFGHDALTHMAADENRPDVARRALAALSAPPAGLRPTPTEIGANIRVYSGQPLPAALLARDWSRVADAPPCLTNTATSCDAFFADMDSDGRNEILLAYGSDTHWWASMMRQGLGGGWYVAGTMAGPPCPGVLTALRAGQFTLVQHSNWRDFLVAGVRLSVSQPALPAACPFS